MYFARLEMAANANNLLCRIQYLLKIQPKNAHKFNHWGAAMFIMLFLLCLIAMPVSWAQTLELPLRGESGELILGLGTLEGAALSPDRRTVASYGGLGVFFWDRVTGKAVRWIAKDSGEITDLDFSSDGKRILTVNDGMANILNAESGAEIQTFTHSHRLKSAVFSPDGTQVLTGGIYDSTAKLWDVESGKAIQTFIHADPYPDRTLCVAFSPDGKQILTGTRSDAPYPTSDEISNAKLWGVENGEEIRTFQSGRTESVVFSPDGKLVMTGSADGTVRIWDAESGVEIQTFAMDAASTAFAVFSPDGSRIIARWNGKATIWNVEDGEEIRTFHTTDSFHSAAFSPDGETILLGEVNGDMKLLEIDSGEESQSFYGHAAAPYFSVFSPDGTRALTGSGSTALLWDAKSGDRIHTYRGHSSEVYSAAFSPDGKQIVTGCRDHTVKLWNAKSGMEIRTLIGQKGRVYSVVFSPDGTRILTGGGYEAILWNAESGEAIHRFGPHLDAVTCAIFSPDGNRIFTSSSNGVNGGVIKVWDATSGVEVSSIQHEYWVHSMAISPNGNNLLTGISKSATILWDAESGAVIQTFFGPAHWVESVGYTSDGRFSLASGDETTIRDMETMDRVRSIPSGSPAAISPDGAKVLTNGDGATRIWDISDLASASISDFKLH